MPVYEYRCPDCTNLFEQRLSFSESGSQIACPSCGTPALKLLSTFAAIGVAGGSDTTAATGPGGGGGCCGGGCCGGG